MATISLKSKALLGGVAAALGLVLGAGPSHMAWADQAPSVQQIIEALKPRKTRGLSVKPTQAEIERAKVIDDLTSKAASRQALARLRHLFRPQLGQHLEPLEGHARCARHGAAG